MLGHEVSGLAQRVIQDWCYAGMVKFLTCFDFLLEAGDSIMILEAF